MMRKNNHDALDLMKFVMSIMVVAIHTAVYPEIVYPWVRLAVPCFFLITAYFLFSKIETYKNDPLKTRVILVNYVKRNLQLYLFWSIITLPVILYFNKTWFDKGIWIGLLKYVHRGLSHGTFTGAWFIRASILSGVLVYFLSRKCSNRTMLIAAIFLHIICALRSSYYFVFSGNEMITNMVNGYEKILSNPVFSVPVALIYFVMIKWMIESKRKHTQRFWFVLAVISGVMCYIEWRIISACSGCLNEDVLLTLPVFALSVFQYVRGIEWKCKYAIELRKSSVIVFVTHGAVIPFVRKAYEIIHFEYNEFYLFVGTAVVCIMISCLISWMQRKWPRTIIRYAS